MCSFRSSAVASRGCWADVDSRCPHPCAVDAVADPPANRCRSPRPCDDFCVHPDGNGGVSDPCSAWTGDRRASQGLVSQIEFCVGEGVRCRVAADDLQGAIGDAGVDLVCVAPVGADGRAPGRAAGLCGKGRAARTSKFIVLPRGSLPIVSAGADTSGRPILGTKGAWTPSARPLPGWTVPVPLDGRGESDVWTSTRGEARPSS
jgi:hypothetical protein